MRLLIVNNALTPITSIQAAILYGFSQVLGGDRVGAVEVGDGTGGFEYPVMRAGTQAHAAHGHFEGSFAGFIEHAKCSEKAGRNAGVIESPAALDDAGGLHSRAHIRRRGAVIFAAQLFVGHRRNLHMQIDAIEQWAAHLAQVTLNDGAGAAAFARGIGKITARTRFWNFATVVFRLPWIWYPAPDFFKFQSP